LLIVTHDLDFANRTDRIITMEDGKIISHKWKNPKDEVWNVICITLQS
jgi:ABC-type polar amino acid transport system ATPase subunit